MLVPYSRTVLHWSGCLGPITRKLFEQKAVFHRKLMGFFKKLNKMGGAKYLFLVRCVLLVPPSRTVLHWSGVSGSLEKKTIFHRK